MKYGSAAAFRDALEHRLRTRARAAESSPARFRKQVVFDRLLARLLQVAPGRWTLKGALALDFRFPERARATKDMDLVRNDSEEASTADLLAAQALDLDDYFAFEIERTRIMGGDAESMTVRYHVRVELAGRTFDEATLDVSFSRQAGVEPEFVKGTRLLGFAGLPTVEVPALPLENHLAEKVHAYTRRYVDDVRSTRPKDLADILVIASCATVSAERLHRALRATFRVRDTHPLPDSLPAPPAIWQSAYARLARSIGLPTDLSDAHWEARRFLGPALRGAASGTWDPSRGEWSAKGQGRTTVRETAQRF